MRKPSQSKKPIYMGRVYVVLIDIINYSAKPPTLQDRLINLLDRLVEESVTRIGADLIIDGSLAQSYAGAGDGGYLILKGDIRHVRRFVDQFLVLLNYENDHTKSGSQLHVRIALGHGRVTVRKTHTGVKHSGNVLNEGARILDNVDKALSGHVVCSEKYAAELINYGLTNTANLGTLTSFRGKHGTKYGYYILDAGNRMSSTINTVVDPCKTKWPEFDIPLEIKKIKKNI